jgi:hypothetical protein
MGAIKVTKTNIFNRYLTLAFTLAVAVPAYAQGLPRGNERDAFIATIVKDCFKIQRAAPGGFSLENIAVYCTCVANGSADVITTADWEYFQRGGKSTPASEQRARAIGLACLEMGFVQGHWRLYPECEALVLARRPLKDCPVQMQKPRE